MGTDFPTSVNHCHYRAIIFLYIQTRQFFAQSFVLFSLNVEDQTVSVNNQKPLRLPPIVVIIVFCAEIITGKPGHHQQFWHFKTITVWHHYIVMIASPLPSITSLRRETSCMNSTTRSCQSLR